MLCLSIPFSPLLALIWSLLLVLTVQVDAAKVTVDDTDPDIHYYQQWAQGPGCSYCWASPDPAQAHGGTWHDAFKGDWTTNVTRTRMFNYTFHGTGIAIYAIVGHGAPYHGSNGSAGMLWNIDGTLSDIWNLPIEPATDPPTYTYNAMVGSRNGMTDGPHVLTVHLSWNQPNFLFDYLVVTNSDPDPEPTTSTSPTAPSTIISNSTSSSTTVSNSTSLQTIPSFTFTVSRTESSQEQATSGINIPISNSNSNNSASTDASKRLSTSATVGIALGTASLLLLLFLLLLWRRQKERRKQLSESLDVNSSFDVVNGSGNSMVSPFAPTEGSSDSDHRVIRDVKAPLPAGDNVMSQQRTTYEQHKPGVPPHDGFVNHPHPYGPAYQQQHQQQSEENEESDECNHNQRAPWFQQTEGSHPVEVLQRHAPSSPPPN
ncbi:hypothetical protein CPB86DRAFT_825832 [Serendipita vermifera]|nr:hypothetical protein CPB86DRAFT_825832 [Serendipita vermifera]